MPTLVTNTTDLIDVLPLLNVTGDPNLTAMVDRLRPLVQHNAKTLRKDEATRQDVAAEAQRIVRALGSLMLALTRQRPRTEIESMEGASAQRAYA